MSVNKSFLIMGIIMLLASQSKQLKSIEHEESIASWQKFLNHNSWQTLIQNIDSHECGCGSVYDLPNFLNREDESFAIADMRNIHYSEPHYHSAHVTEIYFVVQGSGIVVVGNDEYSFSIGDTIVTPPLTTHYVIPDKDCVLAVVNIPEFDIQDYHVVTESNDLVKFDKELFDKLTTRKSEENSIKNKKRVDIINTYFKGLEEGSFEKIISLFHKDAIVYSPLYGEVSANIFYKELFGDTNNSKILLKNVFFSATNPNNAAAHFIYEWIMKDGQKVTFECIDVFEFSENGEVRSLKIIYDTFPVRTAFEKIKN